MIDILLPLEKMQSKHMLLSYISRQREATPIYGNASLIAFRIGLGMVQ
jgi:hypothetical protein